MFEEKLNNRYTSDRKYSFEERNSTSVKVYSKEYSEDYHQMLNCMVERQMQRSIYAIASVWYSAWVDAGQPEMTKWKVD